MGLNYSGGFEESVAELAEHEKAGLDIVFVPEAYSYDAVSQLGFIAARTERVEIASGILQIYTRPPSLTAMTAAGLDYVSGGRFTLGPGGALPQANERVRGVRSPGHRGVPRRALRRPGGTHARDHRDLPPGLGPREGAVRGPALPDPAARRGGHRARQAAEAHQPPGARPHPDRAGRPGREE